MFWIALGLASLAAAFFQMGAYSVWISAAKGFVFLAFLLCGGGLVLLLWRRVFPKKSQLGGPTHTGIH
jgi:hypothetical protein